MKRLIIIIIALLTTSAGAVRSETITVNCVGTVEYNQVRTGIFAGVNGGDSVHVSFTVDALFSFDSPDYNVRAYPIDMTSFQLTIGSVGPVRLAIPQPNNATPFFALRNDDPTADGFFFSTNTEWPFPNPMLDVPAEIDPYFGFHWEVGYAGNKLNSPHILEVCGTYDYTGLTSFYTAIQDAGADAMGIEFVEMKISARVATNDSTGAQVKNRRP